jgi:hypothetical protein
MSFLTFSRHFNKLYINHLAKTQRMFAQMWEISPYHQKKYKHTNQIRTNRDARGPMDSTLGHVTDRPRFSSTPRQHFHPFYPDPHTTSPNTDMPIPMWLILITSNYLHSEGWTSFLNYSSYLDFIDNNSSFFSFYSFSFSLQFAYNASNA